MNRNDAVMAQETTRTLASTKTYQSVRRVRSGLGDVTFAFSLVIASLGSERNSDNAFREMSEILKAQKAAFNVKNEA